MENGCKGCVLEGDCVDGIKPCLSKTQQCPCLNCIVKTMCHEVCEAWTDYVHLNQMITDEEDANEK